MPVMLLEFNEDLEYQVNINDDQNSASAALERYLKNYEYLPDFLLTKAYQTIRDHFNTILISCLSPFKQLHY